MRVGVLTGGGDCPGLNAVIRGVVRRGVQEYGYEFVGFRDGWKGPLEGLTMELGIEQVRGILPRGGTILGSSRTNLVKIDGGIERTEENLRKLGIDALISIGGEDTLGVATTLTEHGFHVIGVPKTIDNDLGATAFTFGFDSAVDCATDALDRLHTTAASHERIMVLEVMGRHAGWIALHSGIAGGGDVILLPEIDWTFENVCRKVLERESEGKRFTLVVVAEGARLPEGGLVTAGTGGAREQVRLGGIGEIVAAELGRRLMREVRTVVLGHLQRGGSPTTFDRVLATEYGAHAVRLVHEGRFGEMVCFRPPNMESVPISEAITRLSRVDPARSIVLAARALGISFGDDAAASPFAAGRPAATPL